MDKHKRQQWRKEQNELQLLPMGNPQTTTTTKTLEEMSVWK